MKIPIYYTQKCKVYTNIPNCTTHNATDPTAVKCTTCDSGYVLSAD
jgi:hypothetical protein